MDYEGGTEEATYGRKCERIFVSNWEWTII